MSTFEHDYQRALAATGKVKPRTATRKQVVKLASELGAEMVVNSEARYGLDVEMMAPEGQIWNATDTHGIVGSEPGPGFAAEVWAGLIGDMKSGLRACDIDDCEFCAGL